MLEKLTKEQQITMIETRDEWINLFFDNVKSQKGIDNPIFEEGIKWLYEDLLEKPIPKVVYCDSWLSCLLTIAVLKKIASVGDSVSDSVRDSVWASVSASVRASVSDSVRASVIDSVMDSVRASVSASVRASVSDSVRASVSASVIDSVMDSVRASVSASVRASVWDSISDSVFDSVRASVSASVGDSVRDSVRDSVGDSVGDSIMASVRDSVGDSVSDSVRDSVWASVGDSVWASVWASVGDSVWDSVSDSVRDSVMASVRASVRDSVRDSVMASVRASVWDSVRASVGDSVMASVWASVGDSISDSVFDSVSDSVWDSFNECSTYLDLSNYGWISFYDFFEKINVLDHFKFKQYKKIIKSGVFNAYEYENTVFAIQPPIHIERDNQGRLHSISDAAVKFKDSSQYFYIHGVGISDNMFSELSENKYSFKSLINERNEEIKAAALSFIEEKYGNEELFRFLSSHLKEIDSYVDKKENKYLVGTTGGMNAGVYTLYKGGIEDINLAFVRCYCPSTDRMFFLSVDPTNDNAKDAIASLYRIPRNLSDKIKYIQRQGERFSTVFTKEGSKLLKTLQKEEISDLVSISGDRYFSLMRYEY